MFQLQMQDRTRKFVPVNLLFWMQLVEHNIAGILKLQTEFPLFPAPPMTIL